MPSKNAITLSSLNDKVLGSLGASIPPSRRLDHTVRYLSTWSGSDKLMMTVQYGAKLLVPLLQLRADLQHRSGLRAKPYSPTKDGLNKFADTLASARRVSGLWGILPIFQWLSAMERKNPTTRTELTIERISGLSMLIFYVLENLSFFASSSAPVLPSSIITPSRAALAQLWSIRAWGVYTALQVLHLRSTLKVLSKKERFAENNASGEVSEQDIKILKRQKQAVSIDLLTNLAYLPLTVHWSVVGGVIKNELLVDALNFVAAIASFVGGWEAARIA